MPANSMNGRNGENDAFLIVDRNKWYLFSCPAA